MKITELRCPACNGTLKIDDKNPNIAVCEYCKTSYVLELEGDNARLGAQAPKSQAFYTPQAPKPESKRTGWEYYGWKRVLAIVCGGILAVSLYYGPKIMNKRREIEASRSAGAIAEIKPSVPGADWTFPDGGALENAGELPFSGILADGAEIIFGQPANILSEEQLSTIRWIEIKYSMDSVMLGYSMENPYSNPEAELSWLEFNRDSAELRMDALSRFKGLTRLRVSSSLQKSDLTGLHLTGISCYCKSPGELAGILENPKEIKELELEAGLESLDGLEQFPSAERLTLYCSKLTDIKDLVNGKQIKYLTLENGDEISDFSVFSVMPWLEGLSIESEKLRDIGFLASMPNLKTLRLSDASLLTLAGLEKNQGTLSELAIESCDEIKDCSAISALTGLTSLSLELPYDCPEPDLSGLSALSRLELSGFQSVAFLSGMSSLRSLTINSSAVDRGDVFSNLTQLEYLKCKSFAGNQMKLDFVRNLPALKELDLTGGATYYDISGIFNMPGLRTLLLDGMECEIDFEKLQDNESLETLRMDGVKLYKNVKTDSDGAILYVDWDDVTLSEHMDFLKHFPNLENLSLAENELTAVDFASGLMKLKVLDIKGNYVTDLKPLAEISTLRQVICTDNPIANNRVLGERVHLIQ